MYDIAVRKLALRMGADLFTNISTSGFRIVQDSFRIVLLCGGGNALVYIPGKRREFVSKLFTKEATRNISNLLHPPNGTICSLDDYKVCPTLFENNCMYYHGRAQ